MKYKYIIYDDKGIFIDSKNDYSEVFDSYEEAEKGCLKEMEELEETCREYVGENLSLTGFSVQEEE